MRGRVLLTVNQPSEAVRALEQAASVNPLPEYLWTLADALRRQGQESKAASVERQLLEGGTATDPRTVALFLATHGIERQHALELAERELTVRRDVFTEDAHAWALASARRFDEAGAAMERALSAHTNDARLFLHAGVIAASTGRHAEARHWLSQADKFRWTLLPSELEILRTHLSGFQNAKPGGSEGRRHDS
jgi:tetratricopeptide (TPR) repeat protein